MAICWTFCWCAASNEVATAADAAARESEHDKIIRQEIDQAKSEINRLTDENIQLKNEKQQKAIAAAKAYLKYTPVSRQQLIEQLQYEDFSQQDAIYGTDHCDVDWNQQAILSATLYLDYTQANTDEIIAQLEYEGFTHDQAAYAAEHVDDRSLSTTPNDIQ